MIGKDLARMKLTILATSDIHGLHRTKPNFSSTKQEALRAVKAATVLKKEKSKQQDQYPDN